MQPNIKAAWLVKPNYSEFTKFGFNDWQGNIITTRRWSQC